MIDLLINGKRYSAEVEPEANLLWVIREHLQLVGTKYGCGEGQCGACTIHVDGDAVRSCQLTVGDASGKSITTIEGIPADHPVKEAWLSEQVPQCGYCQPGHIMEAIAFLSKTPHPSHEAIVAAMDTLLCRCGTHTRILKAVKKAAARGGAR